MRKPYNSVRVALLDENNQVAVLHLSKFNFYTLPGGGIDQGETTEQALAREMQEETGCNCEMICHLGTIEENSQTYDWWGVSECFMAKVRGKKGQPSLTEIELEEGTQVQWHSLQDALGLISNQDINRMPNVENEKNKAIMTMITQRDITILNEAIKVSKER